MSKGKTFKGPKPALALYGYLLNTAGVSLDAKTVRKELGSHLQ